LISGHFGKTLGRNLFSLFLSLSLSKKKKKKEQERKFCVMFYMNDAILRFIFAICSNFSDVFDEDHFIYALANDVKVVKKLPKELATATRAVKHFRSWSSMDYYQEEIASMWEDYQAYSFESFWSFFFF